MNLNLFSVSTEPKALASPSSSYKKNSVSGSSDHELTLYTTLPVGLCILMLVAVVIFIKGRKRNEKNTSK